MQATNCRTPKGKQRVTTSQQTMISNKKKRKEANRANRAGFVHRD